MRHIFLSHFYLSFGRRNLVEEFFSRIYSLLRLPKRRYRSPSVSHEQQIPQEVQKVQRSQERSENCDIILLEEETQKESTGREARLIDFFGIEHFGLVTHVIGAVVGLGRHGIFGDSQAFVAFTES